MPKGRKKAPRGRPFQKGDDPRRAAPGKKREDDPIRQVKEKTAEEAVRSLEVLIELRDDAESSGRLRFDCAVEILNRSVGRPAQVLAGDPQRPLQLDVQHELMRKLKALAQAADAQRGGQEAPEPSEKREEPEPPPRKKRAKTTKAGAAAKPKKGTVAAKLEAAKKKHAARAKKKPAPEADA